MCLSTGKNHPAVEAAYAEVHRYMLNKLHEDDLSDAAYHTIHTNLDLYQFRNLSVEKSHDVFRFAYKATIEQFNSGETVYKKPVQPIRIEEIKPVISQEDAEKARIELFAIFNEKPPENKTLTKLELDDMARLERLKNE
jgi:hypothetical protein